MPLSFHSSDHANLRLGNTIIRIMNLPVWIRSIENDYSARILYLNTDKQSHIEDIREVVGIDTTPVPLGFTNFNKQASYLFRRPSRRTKQGLAEESLSCNAGHIPRISEDKEWRKALGGTIIGSYPTIAVAKKLLNSASDFHSVAITRNWSLTSKGMVCYKFFGVVGSFDSKTNKILLLEEFEYLKEVLEQEVDNG